jgi:hypothetical protein
VFAGYRSIRLSKRHCFYKDKDMQRSLKTVVIVVMIVTLSACAVVGPKSLRNGRGDYNEAIKTTEVEQFLLNIVRMRYNDRPYVLEVSSISSRMEVGARARVGVLGNDDIAALSRSGAEAGVTYLEKPTVVYQPLAGRSFVRQLMTPVSLNTLLMLRQSGWELDDIFRVFVASINGVPNAITGGSSTPEGVPEFSKFLEIVDSMDGLEDAGSLILGSTTAKDVKELAVRIRKDMRKSSEFKQFTSLLNLDPTAEIYRIRIGLDDGGKQEIVISTRPIMSAMFFVGQSIEIPEEIRQSGNAHMNMDLNGNPFDWRQVHSELISIHSSGDRPKNAYAAVKYNGYWYYISANDINSKETLTMLSIVFTLNAGGSSSQGRPVLTIPVD